jgi:malonyl CoA-acyl carrier protein transacylase
MGWSVTEDDRKEIDRILRDTIIDPIKLHFCGYSLGEFAAEAHYERVTRFTAADQLSC